MKSLPSCLRYFLFAVLVVVDPRLQAANSPELVEARAQLLEAFQRGRTDEDNEVKQLRARIAALEYVAQATASSGAMAKTITGMDASTRLVNVDFPGGPASALIDAINKGGGGFNVLAEKADLALELPAFSLRNADPGSLAAALSGLLQQRGYRLEGGQRLPPGQSPVYVLRKLAQHEIPGMHGGIPFQSFQLSPYLENQTVDDIVGAVRTAWEMDPANKPDGLRVKFHPPTGILLVSGTPQGINIVQTVLAQLRKGAEPPAKPKSTVVPYIR